MADGRTVLYLRFTAYGERQEIPANTDDEVRARARLDEILDQVRRGQWHPPIQVKPKSPVVTEPTFGQFATQVWWPQIVPTLSVAGESDYAWQLNEHLLPFFETKLLSEITIQQVDAYRQSKVDEKKLGATSINKTITRLGQILDLAIEHYPGLLPANPARGKRRRLPPKAPRRSFLEVEQVHFVLEAARELDHEAREDRKRIGRRAVMATLILSGIRIGELCELRRSDVDLAGGKLYVREKADTPGKAKSPAGVRTIPISGFLRDELVEYLAYAIDSEWMFPTATGNQRDTNNGRNRIFAVVINRANERLARHKRPLIQPGTTPHDLRRTFISLLCEAGENIRNIMAWAGHSDPDVTLKIYAQVTTRPGSRKGAQELLWEPGQWDPESSALGALDPVAGLS
jgi:integrase